MSLRISFELDDDDLKHFRLIMREARKAVARNTPEDIVAAAESLLQDIGSDNTPGFISGRLQKLRMMIAMISDIDWRLPHEDSKRVLNALAYFAEPNDLIPDQIPGLGFLDDAIMVELVLRELRFEIDAYRDFCAFREEQGRPFDDTRLAARRDELQTRMIRRRQRNEQKSGHSRLRLLP